MNAWKFAGAVVLGVAATACSSSSSPVSPTATYTAPARSADGTNSRPGYAAAARPGSSSIVDLVVADDGEFDVLQAAVVRAGLVEALSGGTQLTVFAPTDAAFVSTLGAGSEAEAIAAVNSLPVDVLTNILMYHVTEGRRQSRSVLAAPEYEMLNGGTLTRDELVAAGIAQTDISASNGIVHVINAVLMP
jgi:uncharacterized surface protein with fasciclin (FAS1) repeats